jgi:hypothetical protein
MFSADVATLMSDPGVNDGNSNGSGPYSAELKEQAEALFQRLWPSTTQARGT